MAYRSSQDITSRTNQLLRERNSNVPTLAPLSKPVTSAMLSKSAAQRLPSSDEEEDLEDSCSDDELAAITQQQQATAGPQRLSRLVRNSDKRQGSNEGPQWPSDLEDDLVSGLGRLGLGGPARPPSNPPPSAPKPGPPRPPAAPKPTTTTSSPPELSEDDTEGSELEDNSEDEPYFERQVPQITATARDPAPTTADPEPGSLVLDSKTQPGQRFTLPAPLAKKLYPHQEAGIRWLWSLWEMQRGGILGDDMGLGKTMQSSAFLAGMLGSRLARRALIIAPKTLLPHWIKELGVCGLSPLTREFFGSSEAERASSLRSVAHGRGVLVTTYGMVQHNAAQLAFGPGAGKGKGGGVGGEALTWDFILLDEGHKIKNPKMKLVEQLRRLDARVRVVISGTPIQNNLMEMHALFDFTTEGLLGDARTFKMHYERPITKGLDRDATPAERQQGGAIAAALRDKIAPYFLRREKKDVLPEDSTSAKAGPSGGASGSGTAEHGASSSGAAQQGAQPQAKPADKQGQKHSLPRKNDLVVWLRLTPIQKAVYRAALETDSVRQVLNEKASPLAAITVLKKICDHPALLNERAVSSVITGAHRWAKGDAGGKAKAKGDRRRNSLDDFIVDLDEEEEEIDSQSEEEDVTEEGSDSEPTPSRGSSLFPPSSSSSALPPEWQQLDGAKLDELLQQLPQQRAAEVSCKSAFVLALLERLTAEGHRTLIFSQSKVMLNILEAGVKAMRLAYCRIDGDVASAEERQALVQRFQTRHDIPVFLLTSQVGGLGLTLTAADRVVIVDPSFNPSIDNQSVDRAYRLGQTRDVVVYRLISCGTVEEKIYRKQVFKGGLSRTGTEEGVQFRYFTQMELRDLFAYEEGALVTSATQQQLEELHGAQRRHAPELARHLELLGRMETVAGFSDHDLLFTQRPQEPAPTAAEGERILKQHEKAGLSEVDQLISQFGSSVRIGGGPSSSLEGARRQAELQMARNRVAEAQSNIVRHNDSKAVFFREMLHQGGPQRWQNTMDALQAKLQAAQDALRALQDGSEPAPSASGPWTQQGKAPAGGPRPGPGAAAANGRHPHTSSVSTSMTTTTSTAVTVDLVSPTAPVQWPPARREAPAAGFGAGGPAGPAGAAAGWAGLGMSSAAGISPTYVTSVGGIAAAGYAGGHGAAGAGDTSAAVTPLPTAPTLSGVATGTELSTGGVVPGSAGGSVGVWESSGGVPRSRPAAGFGAGLAARKARMATSTTSSGATTGGAGAAGGGAEASSASPTSSFAGASREPGPQVQQQHRHQPRQLVEQRTCRQGDGPLEGEARAPGRMDTPAGRASVGGAGVRGAAAEEASSTFITADSEEGDGGDEATSSVINLVSP